MALDDLYNTQPSEQYSVTNTGESFDPFGLKEKLEKDFKEKTGTSYDEASEKLKNSLRENTFNPIREATGIENNDGSVDQDVLDQVTYDPSDGPSVTPGWFESLKSNTGNTVNNAQQNFGTGFIGNVAGGVADRGKAIVDLATWDGPGELLGDVKQAFTGNLGNDGSEGYNFGMIEKVILAVAVIVLGKTLIESYSQKKAR